MNIKLIYVTAAESGDALRIAETVVMENLAACANILDGATSIFRWQGKLCREKEVVLILKTTERRTEELVARIRQLHPYDCPCITVLPVEGGNPAFLQWIADETAPAHTEFI